MSASKSVIAGVLISSALSVHALTLDLRTEGSSGFINGALFATTDQQPTGTGVIQPFLRIESNGKGKVEEGYNATEKKLRMPDVKNDNWERNVQLNDLSVVQLGGSKYYQFLLDINETGNGASLLSLDSLQIYTRSTAIVDGSTLANLSSSSTLRYNMDGLAESEVLLEYRNNHGSGSGDMYAFIPLANFDGAKGTDYLYLYSQFGAKGVVSESTLVTTTRKVRGVMTSFVTTETTEYDYRADSGFEEWAFLKSNAVAAPDGGATAIMLSFGALALGVIARRK